MSIIFRFIYNFYWRRAEKCSLDYTFSSPICIIKNKPDQRDQAVENNAKEEEAAQHQSGQKERPIAGQGGRYQAGLAALPQGRHSGGSHATTTLQVQLGEVGTAGRQGKQGRVRDVGVAQAEARQAAQHSSTTTGPGQSASASEAQQTVVRHGDTERQVQAGQPGTVAAQRVQGVIADVCIAWKGIASRASLSIFYPTWIAW